VLCFCWTGNQEWIKSLVKGGTLSESEAWYAPPTRTNQPRAPSRLTTLHAYVFIFIERWNGNARILLARHAPEEHNSCSNSKQIVITPKPKLDPHGIDCRRPWYNDIWPGMPAGYVTTYNVTGVSHNFHFLTIRLAGHMVSTPRPPPPPPHTHHTRKRPSWHDSRTKIQ
jgi:hypothetical protein